jgi:CPA1 family monovalent cation:H+ antiporter
VLGVRSNVAEQIQVRNEARLAALTAATAAVDDMAADSWLPVSVADALREALRQRAERLKARMGLLQDAGSDATRTPESDSAVRAQHAVIAAQREELVRWRDCGRLPDESLRQLQQELDHEERTLPGPP